MSLCVRSGLGLLVAFPLVALGALASACGSGGGDGATTPPNGDPAPVEAGSRLDASSAAADAAGSRAFEDAALRDGPDAAPVGSEDARAPTDAPASSPDAAAPDAAAPDAAPPLDAAPPVDAAPGIDAAVPLIDAGTVACGPTWCRDGETCVSGACVLADCNGAVVAPGDNTLGAAIAAIEPSGGTLCLTAGAYGGAEVTSGTKPLLIRGLSADQTSVRGILVKGGANVTIEGVSNALNSVVDDPGGRVLLRNVTLHQLGVTLVSGTDVTVRSATLFAPDTPSASVQIDSGNGGGTVLFDGVDVSGANGNNVAVYWVDNTTNGTASVTVQNSYLHDAYRGVLVLAQTAGSNDALTLLNDTFTSNATGLLTMGMPASSHLAVTYFNDLFSNNPLAIELDGPASGLTLSHGNQALHGNSASYGGVAAAGPGYVTSNPLLDTSSTPPAPGAGSPCRGAGDGAHAPPNDYWGQSRAARVDIGAVQGR